MRRSGGMVSRPPIPAPLWNTIPPEAQAAILALVASLEQRITDLETENADLRRQLAQVEHQLQNIRRRGRRTSHRCDEPHGPRTDRRRQEHRRHPGSFRPQPPPGTVFIEHDVRPQQCSHCGARDLEATGRFEDHVVADLPEPRLEWHRYRRHIYRCRSCQRTCQGRGDLGLPGAHIGPRARFDVKGFEDGVTSRKDGRPSPRSGGDSRKGAGVGPGRSGFPSLTPSGPIRPASGWKA